MTEGVRVHHIMIAIPSGGETESRHFYGRLLGLSEISKPEALTGRGGLWFLSGDLELHLGVDPDFRPARKAHIAFLVDDLDSVVARMTDNNVDTQSDALLPGFRRCYLDDPFGNRLELLERK